MFSIEVLKCPLLFVCYRNPFHLRISYRLQFLLNGPQTWTQHAFPNYSQVLFLNFPNSEF